MKFPPFEYSRPATLGDAFEILAGDEDAKVLAGGQSLLPLMALRLARPSRLVDLASLGLDGIDVERDNGDLASPMLRLGAMVHQSRLCHDPVIRSCAPLLAGAARHVGHSATRNLGTLGGSVAHADPAAELPAAALALGASVVAEGPGGRRLLSCGELADGYFSTTLEPGEIIIEVRVPIAGDRHGAAWCEWAPRSGDFADAGVGVAVETDDEGACNRVLAGACGIAATPVDLAPVISDAVLGSTAPRPDLLRGVAAAVRQATAPAGDEKAELAGLLAARSLARAFHALTWSASSVGA